MEPESQKILSGYSEEEKAAYLGALASLATADRHADEEELEQLRGMAAAAGLSDTESKSILDAANDTTGDYLLESLSSLKTSELRFSLVTDLIALAKADDVYSPAEKSNIEKVSRYLGVNRDQFSVLDQFVDKAVDKHSGEDGASTEDVTRSVNMQNQFAGAGINMGSITKGLLGFLGPMILGSIASKTLGAGRRVSTGGLGGMFGNDSIPTGKGGDGGGLGGGLGSIIAGLSRGRGNQSIGGMLGRLLK